MASCAHGTDIVMLSSSARYILDAGEVIDTDLYTPAGA
jgi:hypothetical protein